MRSPRQRGIASGGTSVSFCDYGIQSLGHAYITNRQIEAARIAINRHIRLEIETLRSPARIERMATGRLHMVAPSADDAIITKRP